MTPILYFLSVYLCIHYMELGEAKQFYDTRTALIDAVIMAFGGVEFEPMEVSPDEDDDEDNTFLSGSERRINGYDVITGTEIDAVELFYRELIDGQEEAIWAMGVQWGEEDEVVFDLDTFNFSVDGENELTPDDPEFAKSCRKAISGLMVCMSDM